MRKAIVTVIATGGMVYLALLAAKKLEDEDNPLPMRIIGFKDTFCGIGPADELLEKHGLTSSEIA